MVSAKPNGNYVNDHYNRRKTVVEEFGLPKEWADWKSAAMEKQVKAMKERNKE